MAQRQPPSGGASRVGPRQYQHHQRQYQQQYHRTGNERRNRRYGGFEKPGHHQQAEQTRAAAGRSQPGQQSLGLRAAAVFALLSYGALLLAGQLASCREVFKPSRTDAEVAGRPLSPVGRPEPARRKKPTAHASANESSSTILRGAVASREAPVPAKKSTSEPVYKKKKFSQRRAVPASQRPMTRSPYGGGRAKGVTGQQRYKLRKSDWV